MFRIRPLGKQLFARPLSKQTLTPLRIGLAGSLVATGIIYHNNMIKNDVKKKIALYKGEHDLKPDPQGDTYENSLFLSSQKELEADESQYREDRKKGILKYINVLRFAFKDYVWEPIVTIGRFIELLLIFSPILVALPISFLGKRQPHKSNEKRGAILWYKIIRYSLENAGASFIKLGQWAASRTDIFPTEFCNELGNLHSNAKKHSFHYTKTVLKESFGGLEIDEIFKELDTEPIGVGAIAQVYLGTLSDKILKDEYFQIEGKRKKSFFGQFIPASLSSDQPVTNQRVAIKVMHPNVEVKIYRDLKIMNFFASAIDIIPTMEWLSLPDEVKNFEILMNLQLDLRIEGLNLLKFQENFQNDIFINFPKPYLRYSNRFILVEEFINGISMSKLLELKALSAKKKGNNDFFKKMSDELIDSFLQMLILNNFIHSDLHPGNIFVRFLKTNEMQNQLTSTKTQQDQIVNELNKIENNDEFLSRLRQLYHEGYQPEICYIDAGLVTELNDSNRVNFIALFNALAEFDGYKAGELMIERSKTPETAIDSELFALKVERLVDKIKQRTFTLGTVSIGDLLEKMLSMVRSHHVRMEGDFISVIVAILLIEGLGRQLDPELDLFASSLPILRQLGLKDQEDKLAMVKVWLTLEVRQFISLSIQDIYKLVKSDGLCANY